MRKTFFQIAAIAIVLILAGCIDSVHPPYYESDIIFDKNLLGKWQQTEDSLSDGSRAVFEKKDDKTYKVLFDEGKPEPDILEATLFKIGKFTYIDFVDQNVPEAKHSIWKIHIKKDFISLEVFDKRWFDSLVERNKADIGYEKGEYVYYFTAETDDLRQFFIDHEENIFTKEGKIKYERIAP